MITEVQNPVVISQLISERFPMLTKSEKRIGTYLNHNQDEAAFLSAGEIAERLKLSEATMVRFARTLGFDSYPAMRVALQESFRNRMTHSARMRSRLDDLREGGDLFEKVTILEIDFLTQALQTVNRDSLKETVELMMKANRIFVFGTGPSVSLTHMLTLRLTRFGKQVIPIAVTGRESLESLILMTKDDLLFAIGFFDINPTLQVVIDAAAEKSCPIVLLTDTLGPVMGEKANILISARRGPVSAFHSLVVPMTIINALLLDYANKNLDMVTGNLDRLDQLRERLKQPQVRKK